MIFRRVQSAKSWLHEFHAGYEDSAEYRQVYSNTGNEEDANTFYAAALWMNDAVPRYGELIQEELNNYQVQLVKMRQAANDASL